MSGKRVHLIRSANEQKGIPDSNLTVLSACATFPLAAGGETGGRDALSQLQGRGGWT